MTARKPAGTRNRPRAWAPARKTGIAGAAAALLMMILVPLQAVFAALRLSHATGWSWWAVMSPGLAAVAVWAGAVLAGVAWAVTARRENRGP